MNSLKKNSLVLVLLLFVFLAGCAGSGSVAEGSGNVLQSSEQQGGDLYLDSAGRKVQVPKDIQTIAALDSFSGEVMVLIGAGDKMSACPNGIKSDALLQQIDPGLKDKTVVQSGGDINAEELLKLNPDVILIKQDMYNTKSIKGKLDKLDIPYLVVGYTDMTQQIALIRMIGELTGGASETAANGIADYYQEVIEKVTEDAAKIPAGEKVSVYHCMNGTSMTDGLDSIGYDWITAVGCEVVSAGEDLQNDGKNYYATAEQLFIWDPDVIITQETETADSLLKEDTWNGLRAVEEKRVYHLPVGATRWGQEGDMETFFAMIWLGKTVYPDYYTDFDLKQEVTNFYKEYENLTIHDESYQQILSGVGIRKAGMGNSSAQ